MSNPKLFDLMVKQLTNQVTRGDHLIAQLPRTLRAVLGENEWHMPMWRERIDMDTGEVYTFDRFEDFVTATPTAGIGASMDMLRDVCRGDPIAKDMLDRAVQRPTGRPKLTITNRDSYPVPPNESQQGTIRTLRKNAPEFHAQVLSGEMSPAQAAKAAGLRRPRISIYLDSPQSAATTIYNHATPEFIEELRRLLNE